MPELIVSQVICRQRNCCRKPLRSIPPLKPSGTPCRPIRSFTRTSRTDHTEVYAKITTSGRRLTSSGPQPVHTAFVHEAWHLRPEPNGLRRYGCDNTIGRPLQEVPDERATNAEAQRHELVDAQVIHQTE